MWRVTLPSIRRTFALVIIIEVVLQFQLFGQAQLMTQGGPNNASRPIVLFIYRSRLHAAGTWAMRRPPARFCSGFILIAAIAQYPCLAPPRRRHSA